MCSLSRQISRRRPHSHQSCDATNRNLIQGRRGQVSGPSITKPCSFICVGKSRACAATVVRLIQGDLPHVPVSRACPKGAHGRRRLRSCPAEVSRGRSTSRPFVSVVRKGRTMKNKGELPTPAERGHCSDRSQPIRRASISQPWACLRKGTQERSLLLFAEPPSADPHARWCGEGARQRAPLPDLNAPAGSQYYC